MVLGVPWTNFCLATKKRCLIGLFCKAICNERTISLNVSCFLCVLCWSVLVSVVRLEECLGKHMAIVGVLALQGSFNEHIAALRRLGVKGVEIRKPEQLRNVTSLIIPGGESTTMAKLAESYNLFPALREFVKMDRPVWGTCAGLILLANNAIGQKTGGQELIGGLDCTVHRNLFGSQLQSFEAELSVPEIASSEGGPETFRGVFIRAPAILEVGKDVQVLADYPAPSNGLLEENIEEERRVIVAVRQGNILATAFHPELTADTRWHSYFLKMAEDTGEEALSSPVPVRVDLSCEQQPRNDLPIFR